MQKTQLGAYERKWLPHFDKWLNNLHETLAAVVDGHLEPGEADLDKLSQKSRRLWLSARQYGATPEVWQRLQAVRTLGQQARIREREAAVRALRAREEHERAMEAWRRATREGAAGAQKLGAACESRGRPIRGNGLCGCS